MEEEGVDEIVLDSDYYLLSFTEAELYDVLLKQDEWSEHDVEIAQELLKKKGFKIDEIALSRQREERMANFRLPDKNQTWLIIIGYIFAIFGGFLGLLFGYALYATKKELPSGERIHRYSESNRKSGLNILIISAITLSIGVVLKLTVME